MLMLGFHFIWVQLVLLFAGGMVMLHFAGTTVSKPLTIGGWVLTGAAILSAVCVLYYAARYASQDAFDSARPACMHEMKKMKMMRSKDSPADHPPQAGAPAAGADGEHVH